MSGSSVLFPIETKGRELDGKLWLGLHAVNQGHDVVLGHDMEVRNWIDRLQPDIYVTVSASGKPEKRDRLQKLREEGVEVVVLDVEGGIFRRDDDFKVRLSPAILDSVDTYLAWGEQPGRLVSEYTSFPEEDIYVTGEPKFDLLHEKYRSYYRDNADAIEAEFGDYFLFTTNFGLVNHYDDEQNRDLMSRDQILRLKKPEDELKFVPHQEELLDGFLDAIPKLAQSFEEQLVIRPHPSEDLSTYENVADGLEGVHVIQRGNAHSWILGSQAVIHNNSTIGVESVLLDTPTIAYCPVLDEEYELILPNEVSRRARTFEALRSELEDSLQRDPDFREELPAAKRDLLASYFRNIDGKGAQRVTEILDSVEHGETWTEQRFDVSALERLKRTAKLYDADRLYHGIRQLLTSWEPSGYTDQKFPGITEQEIVEKLDRMQELKTEFSDLDLSVSQYGRLENCFEVSGTRSGRSND